MVNQNRVVECICRLLGMKAEDVKQDADLEDGLGMDSMDKIELVMALEEEFEIMLDDEEIEKCKTVADVVALVDRVAA